MNWQKAGVILVTLGVTATVGYVGYSYITSAKSNHISDFLETCKETDFVKGLSDSEKDLGVKNASKLTKKEVSKLVDFCKKESLTDDEQEKFDKIISNWKIKSDEK